MNREALAALAAIRPVIARLDRSRPPADVASDIAAAWTGVESALRALLRGSPAGGQTLIHEARQRHLLTFGQANALAAFNAAHERCADGAYQANETDINAAREGFLELESSLTVPDGAEQTPPQGEAMSTKGLRLSPLGTPRPVALPPERQPWWFLLVWAALIAALAVGAWFVLRGRGDGPTDTAIDAWRRGDRGLALTLFEQAVRANPRDATAHVYLARLAREGGDLALAREYATLAVQAEPGDALALREMGAVLLAAGNYELARRFYVRAVGAAPDDRVAQGFLGCTLLKLGRPDEGERWLGRAGPGDWSVCAAAVPATATRPTPRR